MQIAKNFTFKEAVQVWGFPEHGRILLSCCGRGFVGKTELRF